MTVQTNQASDGFPAAKECAMTRSPFALAIGSGCLLISVGLADRAHAQRPMTPSLAMASLSGRDLFQFYCASCHGYGGKGDGPVAASLKQSPPDLTRIAWRHDGRFPTEEVEQYVSGELVAAHGNREMPVRGPIFRSFEPRDALTRVRIENVVKFVESMQSR